MEGEPEEKGEIVLTVGSPFPHSGDLGLADAGAEDATLVAQGYAALTALRGPRAEDDPELLTSSTRASGRRSRASASPAELSPAALSRRRPGGGAARFVWERRRLDSTRRTWEPLVGRVGAPGGLTRRPASSLAASR